MCLPGRMTSMKRKLKRISRHDLLPSRGGRLVSEMPARDPGAKKVAAVLRQLAQRYGPGIVSALRRHLEPRFGRSNRSEARVAQ